MICKVNNFQHNDNQIITIIIENDSYSLSGNGVWVDDFF